MTDETDARAMDEDPPPPAPPKGLRPKTILILAGACLAGIGATVGATTLVVMKVDRVHKAWCDRVHLFCATTGPALAAAPEPKTPEGCPDLLVRGVLTPRGQDDAGNQLTAALRGKIYLTFQGQVRAGRSSIVCFDKQFLASFTSIQQDATYQCMGSIDGNTFSGVCDRSRPGRWDISGEFFDDAKLRADIEDRRPTRLVTDAAEDEAQKAMDRQSDAVKKEERAAKDHKPNAAKGPAPKGDAKAGAGPAADDKAAQDKAALDKAALDKDAPAKPGGTAGDSHDAG